MTPIPDLSLDPDTIAASQRIRAWHRQQVNKALAEFKPFVKPELRHRDVVVGLVPSPSFRPAPKPKAKPKPSTTVPITAQQILERQKAGESCQRIAESLRCSPDALWRKLRIAGLANLKCRHCQNETGREARAIYCFPCSSLKRRLTSAARRKDAVGEAAREALAGFDGRAEMEKAS